MSQRALLTVQIHHGGSWHDAATLAVDDIQGGIRSPTTVDYEAGYFVEHGSVAFAEDRPVIDWRAISVNYPIDLNGRRTEHWAPFLLDLLPQGHARRHLAEILRHNPDDETIVYDLLLRGAGCPVGNMRIKEAWENERERLKGKTVKGMTTQDVFDRSRTFRSVAERFALVASGSSGVQGEWPKILMTQAADELWYPDPVVADENARQHVIVKLTRGKWTEDRLILEAEAPYIEVARAFGLRVGAPLTHRDDTLVIPRFDRRAADGRTVRLGQESLVSALGVAEYGHNESHEAYIAVLHRCCTDPKTEIIEYVLRDALNRAMGDTDNHGRNTALQKCADGTIRLTPRFDFAPMLMDPSGIIPHSRWRCLRNAGLDYRADLICDAVGEVTGEQAIADAVADALTDRADMMADLQDVAMRHRVPRQVIERAFSGANEVAEGLRAFRDRRRRAAP